jgi:hypothetical protein
MRSTPLLACLVLACLVLAACSNNAEPRLIAGGGIGDGEIDGRLNVHVIDGADAPIANATVRVGDTEATTDERGLVTFEDLEGPQTISVKAEGFRSAVWVAANGANVTIPVEPLAPPAPDQATLSGTIPGWDTITVGQNHVKAAIVFYSQTDDLGDDANSIATPNLGNICGVVGPACTWTLAARTGALTVVAMIVDRDTKGTPVETDDTTTVIGWASRTVTVEKNVNQSGLELTMIEAGNLQRVAIDLGAPPAALTETNAIVGIEIADDEVIQLPIFLTTDDASVLAPKPSVFAPDATYRLTAIAQTASGEDGAQSIVLRRGLRDAQLAAGTWLVPPTGLDVTRTRASFSRVEGAKLHTVSWEDAADRTLLDITLFDGSITAIDIPSLVSLPVSGTLTARVTGIAADLDLGDFSLEEDADLLHGLAAEPITIP